MGGLSGTGGAAMRKCGFCGRLVGSVSSLFLVIATLFFFIHSATSNHFPGLESLLYMAFIGHCKSDVLEVSDVVDRNFDYFKSDLK